MQKKAPLYTIDSYSKEAYRKEVTEVGSIPSVREYLLQKNVGFKEIDVA